jgi:hypothetical protein
METKDGGLVLRGPLQIVAPIVDHGHGMPSLHADKGTLQHGRVVRIDHDEAEQVLIVVEDRRDHANGRRQARIDLAMLPVIGHFGDAGLLRSKIDRAAHIGLCRLLLQLVPRHGRDPVGGSINADDLACPVGEALDGNASRVEPD